MKRVVLTLAMLAAGAASAQAQTWYHYECTDGARFEVGF
jgi:D-alanyl-D-alanine dipeptidase